MVEVDRRSTPNKPERSNTFFSEVGYALFVPYNCFILLGFQWFKFFTLFVKLVLLSIFTDAMASLKKKTVHTF